MGRLKAQRWGYWRLVGVSALVGAGAALLLAALGIAGPAVDGGIGFAVILWVSGWANLRGRSEQKPCP